MDLYTCPSACKFKFEITIICQHKTVKVHTEPTRETNTVHHFQNEFNWVNTIQYLDNLNLAVVLMFFWFARPHNKVFPKYRFINP